MKKYLTVAVLGWQDALVYRLNALVWVLYAVLPSVTLMLVWIAAYQSGNQARVGGLTLSGMITYYLCVTALSVAITPHPEWEMATQIRDGKITPFIVRPIGYFGYRLAQETAYQIVKTVMMLPALALVVWLFRSYIQLPPFDAARTILFLISSLLAYMLLSQIKFLLGLSAFWFAEVNGLLEVWNTLVSVFAGRLLPLALLPFWLSGIAEFLPFSILYVFPLNILLARATPMEIVSGFARQIIWLFVLAVLVRLAWRRGLLAYEGYGG